MLVSMSDKTEEASATAALLASLQEELKLSRESCKKLTQEFAAFQTDTAAKLGVMQAENEKLKKGDGDDDDNDLTYCEHSANTNPFPRRPKNCTIKPQSFDLYGDGTADLLELKTGSSLRWEYRVLAPALSYLHDAKSVNDSVKDDVFTQCSENTALSVEAALNTIDGCFELLTGRYATIKIRTRAEAEPGGLSEENKLLLDYLDTKLHGVFPGEALVDSKVEGWLSEYKEKRAAAELKNAVNSGSKSKVKFKEETSDTSTKKNRNNAKKQGVKPKPKAA